MDHEKMMRIGDQNKRPKKFAAHRAHIEKAKLINPARFEKDYERIREKYGLSKERHEELIQNRNRGHQVGLPAVVVGPGRLD